MQHAPLISIIMPCYNYGHLLRETIASLQQQTFTNWECFVIDDGSTDNTNEVVQLFSAKDNRIKYFYQPNLGQSVARNIGIKNSLGEFIQFLDADDLLENKKLEVQSKILTTNPDFDIIYSNINYFLSNNPKKLFNNICADEKNNKPWMKKISGKGEAIIQALLKENIMTINSPLIRKSVFERVGMFDETLKFNEDWELWVRCAIHNIFFLFDDTEDTNALVRVHSTSYSKDSFMMYVCGLKVCLQMNSSLRLWKYKKIMMPKILYHQKILDKKILQAYHSSKNQAAEMAELIYKKTNLFRYLKYKWMLKNMPYMFCLLYSKIFFVTNKFINTIIYGG